MNRTPINHFPRFFNLQLKGIIQLKILQDYDLVIFMYGFKDHNSLSKF